MALLADHELPMVNAVQHNVSLVTLVDRIDTHGVTMETATEPRGGIAAIAVSEFDRGIQRSATFR